MASTSAFILEERQEHIIAPDDSDFLDSDVETTSHPDDHLIESAVLQDFQTTPHRSKTPCDNASAKIWPAHPLIRIHKRLWFTYFAGKLPSEDDLNEQDGQPAAWKNFDDDEIKKYVDPTETNPSRLHWVNFGDHLFYLRFCFDWGPLNVGMFYRFCLHVHQMLTDPDLYDATLVFYTTNAPARKANAALLITLYAMIIGKVSPADAIYPISEVEFKPFRDAGYGRADYNLSIQDILYGVHRAINQGLLDLTTFNIDEYEHYEQVSQGDWNWITPNFIAFASPNDRDYVEALRVGEGRLPCSYSFRPPAENKLFGRTIRYFKNRGVKLVVRLNNPLYDREAFINAGIDHSDMYFDDGSNPTDDILVDFIAKADKVITQGGVVAVHCKAGLGRTGVLIGAYLVWKHGFSAGEAIGFMRFMRPGCVVGPQQHFMYQNFVEWIKWGVRDHAMKEAKQLIAEERAKIEAAQAAASAAAAANAAATESSVANVARASIKRRAAGSDAAKSEKQDDSLEAELQAAQDEAADHSSEDDDMKHAQVHKQVRRKADDEERPRQKQKSDSGADCTDVASGSVTPKAQRGTSRAVPQSAAPGVKPAPCVGQPRKSPSPSRKRPAIQAPATVARLEFSSRRYPTATRSFNNHLMLSSQSVHLDVASSMPVTNDTATASDDGDSANEASFSNDDKVCGASNAASQDVASPRGATGGILVESRINVAPISTTPRASPKAAVVDLNSSPVARVRGFERSRSNTISTATISTRVRGSSRRDTSVSPSPSPKPEVFRASPNIRDRYGLRETSQSPPAQAPATPVKAGGGMSRQASPIKGAAAVVAKMSDAEVLGVIDAIPQQHLQPSPDRVSTRRPSPAPRTKLPSPETNLAQVSVMDENVPATQQQQQQQQQQQAPPPPVVVHRAPLTAGTTTKVLRSVRSKPKLNASSINPITTTTTTTNTRTTTMTSNGINGTARVGVVGRKPISTHRTVSTTTAVGGGIRSASAKIVSTVSSSCLVGKGNLRTQKSSSDLRDKSSVVSNHDFTNHRVVNNDHCKGGRKESSRFTAPTVASLARRSNSNHIVNNK